MAAIAKSASKGAVVRTAFKPAVAPFKAPVANTKANNAFLVWQPTNNKYFETFSFLPPLSEDDIAKQVDYIVDNGWTPAVEFANSDVAYTTDRATVRLTNGASAGYYDNRYWTMWRLPLFGCTDASQVLKEINAAAKAAPDAYIRVVAFDSVKQVQVAGFLVQRPRDAKDYQPVAKRSIGENLNQSSDRYEEPRGGRGGGYDDRDRDYDRRDSGRRSESRDRRSDSRRSSRW